MKRSSRWVVGLVLLAGMQLTACSKPAVTAVEEEGGPAKVEHLDGVEPTRVTLTKEAAERLDIQTEAVRMMELGGKQRLVMPYAAVLYDTDGNTWTYTNPSPLVFVRHPVKVDYIEGELAVLTEGPLVATAVVIVGAQELYGSELEFEEE